MKYQSAKKELQKLKCLSLNYNINLKYYSFSEVLKIARIAFYILYTSLCVGYFNTNPVFLLNVSSGIKLIPI